MDITPSGIPIQKSGEENKKDKDTKRERKDRVQSKQPRGIFSEAHFFIYFININKHSPQRVHGKITFLKGLCSMPPVPLCRVL